MIVEILMRQVGAILAEHAVEMGGRQRIVGEVGRIALLQPGQQIERRCDLGLRAAGMHPLDIEDELPDRHQRRPARQAVI